MSKKYIVTIMDKHPLGDETVVLRCDHAEVGEIDEKTLIFKDSNGNEYSPMLSNVVITDEKNIYSNVLDLHDIKDITGNKDSTLKESLEEYESVCKKIIYYVGKTNKGEWFSINFNIDEILKKREELLKQYEEYGFSEEDEDFMEEDEIISGFSELIDRIEDDVFTYDELNDMLKYIGDKVDESVYITELIKEKLSSMNEIEEEYEELEKQRKKDKKEAEDFFKDYFGWEEDTNEDFYNQLDEFAKKYKSEAVTEEDKKIADMVEKYLDTKALSKVKTKEEEKKKKSEKKNSRIDIEDLFRKVTKTLIAQDEPARRVIAEIARKEMDDREKRQGILLTGQTGVGKTELMRLIAKYLDRPFHKIDSTQLTIPGYIGRDIEEELWDLHKKCNYNLNKTQNAIIFFDEIDKKGSDKKSDVSGKGVLNVLLPFIEGTVYEVNNKREGDSVKIDTSNMIVILGGAYTDVYKNLLGKNGIGFNKDITNKSKTKEATVEDFVKKGKMTEEFMGRVMVVKLNDLDVDAIKRIMLDSDESALRIQKEIFEKLGVKLTFTDGYIDLVAKKAYDKKTGARGLKNVVSDTTWQAFDKVYSSDEGEYEEVIINEETAGDPSKYQLIKKNKNVYTE